MTMTPEIKANWVAALRSGEYTQGTETMHLNGRHCCLGVLRHLITGSNDVPETDIDDGSDGVTMPTAEELEAWGLTLEDAEGLANKNDGTWDSEAARFKGALTFAGIASYIAGRLTL